MSLCTYIASHTPLPESAFLWPLSRGGEDIYTEKSFVAQIAPDLADLSCLLTYVQKHMYAAEELELWHIWQGVESQPVIRSETVSVQALSIQHLTKLQSQDVFATATQYGLPVQYRLVVVK